MGSVLAFRSGKMEPSQKTFGDWLRDRREAAHLSQQEVADRAGVSKAYVSNIERNMPHSVSKALPKPTVDKVDALCKAVGASISEGRLIAGYAAPHIGPADADQTRLLFYFNDLLEVGKADALALIEALWRQQQSREKRTKAEVRHKKKQAN
jgi:transcriptional regulator with XRE-family HTH domain